MFVTTIDRLADEITTLAAQISAATARWLTLIAEFDARGGWGPGGFKSCAHWVAFECSVAPATAREYVRVARRLTVMPEVSAVFARGELSYSQVRALTRVENVSDEPGLIELARSAGAARLERIVRGYRTMLEIEGGAERQHEERHVSWSYDDQGALVVRGRLPAEQGALVVAALEAARDQLGPPDAGPEAEPGASAETPVVAERVRVGARNADALVALAGVSLGSAAGGSSAERYQVVVHVDAAQLVAGAGDEGPEGEGRCELENGVPLPREAVRRLGCDASLVRIVERDGRPLSVGRRTRSIPPALRRALRARDGGCSFPGCTQTRHVDAHHIHHWADGGRTDLANLVQLCRHHHRLVHEGGFGLRRGAQGPEFTTPGGRCRGSRGAGAATTARSSTTTSGGRCALPRKRCARRASATGWTCPGQLTSSCG
jgi:hypothetical protein